LSKGYVFILGGGVVIWRTKKQNDIDLSSTEVEYMALSKAAMESIWMRWLQLEKKSWELMMEKLNPIKYHEEESQRQWESDSKENTDMQRKDKEEWVSRGS
jgi:hypothetical protein